MILCEYNEKDAEFSVTYDEASIEMLKYSLENGLRIPLSTSEHRYYPKHYPQFASQLIFKHSSFKNSATITSDCICFELRHLEYDALPFNIASRPAGGHFHIDLDPINGDIFGNLVFNRV